MIGDDGRRSGRRPAMALHGGSAGELGYALGFADATPDWLQLDTRS